MPGESRSPYQVVLGDELDGLHPRLRAYFSAIPSGSVGVGEGTFTTVGTPRRWLWPALWLLARQGVLFPVWERDVPFTVHNRPGPAGAAPLALAVRTFRFQTGERRMLDAIGADRAGLFDRLGTHGLIETRLAARIDGGALRLDSTGVALRLSPLRIVLPRFLAPTVSLTERFDDDSNSQQVQVVVTAPCVGILYEYAGSFRYFVQPGENQT